MSTAPAAVSEAIRVSRAFPLDEPGALWLVESGKLDVFLAPLESGSPAGALTHVARVEEGGAVFALPSSTPGSNHGNFGFLAAPAAETTVRVCALTDFSPAELKDIATPWLRGLAAPEGLTLEGRTLKECNEAAVARLIRQRMQSDEEEAQRLAARTRTDEKIVSAALRMLARPLARTAADDVAASSIIPLAAACTKVAEASGITLRIPPSVIHGKAKDPLRAIARHSSVRMRRLVLQGDWWKQDSGPMLAFLDADNAPVALLPRSVKGYDLFDPRINSRVRVDKKSARMLSGVSWTFYRPFPHRALNGADVLIAGLHGCGRDLWTIGITGFLAALLSLVTPWATGIVFDSIVPGSERGQLLETVALILASAIAMAFISLSRGYALLRVEGKLDFAAQAALWDRLLNLPTAFFRNYTAGDLTWRSLAISQIRALLTESTIASLLSGIFSLTSFGLLLYYSPALSMVAAALVSTALAVTLAGGLIQLRLQRQVAEMSGRIGGMVFEFVGGIAKFKASGTEGRAFARWAAAFADQKRVAATVRRISNLLSVFNSGFTIFAMAILYLAVADQMNARAGGLSTGTFLAFSAAFGQLLASTLALGGGILSIFRILPLYARLKPILETLPEIDAGSADPGELSGNIEASHVAFRYAPGSPTVLRDISFRIGSGEFVAFTGPSGSGKSTLLRLLLGFEKPSSGAIFYDGQDLSGLDVQEVRHQIGTVLQNGKLLPGDILTNIVGSAPLTVADAWEAARMAGLEEDIQALPMGMYTMVAEGGKGLSGGQRQRLMIARALVGKPRILLVDEATSALDNRTQDIVSRAMEKMQVTRIVIAHRLSTIMKADRIFVLDQGTIVQTGTYAELIGQPGFFAEFARRQIV